MTEPTHALPLAAAPALDFTTAVQQIYRALLSRDVDPEGLEHWRSVALQANSIEPVITGIVTSAEYRFSQERGASDLLDVTPFNA